MCTPEYVQAKQEQITTLLELILDLEPIDGACFSGGLIESLCLSEIVLSLTKLLTTLKVKELDIPIEEAQRIVQDEIIEIMHSRLDRLQIEAMLHRMRN